MRMTKIIREYVGEQITLKFHPYLLALNKKYPCEEAIEAIENIKKEVEEVAKRMFAEKLAPYYDPEDLKSLMDGYNINRPSCWGIEPIQKKAYREERDKLEAARNKAIKETLLTMELGGTKADLDRMLAEINPEAV